MKKEALFVSADLRWPLLNPETMILECIAGKDDRQKVIVGEQPIKLGGGQGYVMVWMEQGRLRLDAGSCSVPVYVNNQPITMAVLHEQDIIRMESAIWKVLGTGHTFSTSILKEKFSGLIGLEELKDFKLSDIFSEVFKSHSQEEMEEQLITGTSHHTPALSSLQIGWAKPWLFARLLGISVALTCLLYAGFETFQNDNLIPGLIFVGSFAVPFSALIFFLEMNVPRNVSIFKVIQLLFVGGIASLLVALIFFNRLDYFSSWLGVSAAGIIEESAKLLIVALLMGRAPRYHWILNGLLFGAAIGTGFGAFESAGYAFRTMLGSTVENGVNNLMLRGLLAPFTHIVWTANSAAALWLVKGKRVFTWDMLMAPAFLRIFIPMVLLHMIWDAPFEVIHLPLGLDGKWLILGVLAWIICLRLVQAGLKQLNAARLEEIVV
jgi:protease PrsW